PTSAFVPECRTSSQPLLVAPLARRNVRSQRPMAGGAGGACVARSAAAMKTESSFRDMPAFYDPIPPEGGSYKSWGLAGSRKPEAGSWKPAALRRALVDDLAVEHRQHDFRGVERGGAAEDVRRQDDEIGGHARLQRPLAVIVERRPGRAG